MPAQDGQKKPGVRRRRHGGEQPRHIADLPVGDAGALDATVRSPTTDAGLPVEDQIRKEWDPKKDGGLPTSLARRVR